MTLRSETTSRPYEPSARERPGNQPDGRGTHVATIVRREDYFAAALEILAAHAHAGLEQARLCAHVAVTTGSFYNHFASWAEFEREFLQHWLDKQTVQLSATARLEGSPRRRLEMLIDFACRLPHSAESAIRGWAHCDHAVRDVQALVDRRRLDVVAEATTAILDPGDEAHRSAQLAIFALAGFQQVLPTQDVSVLRSSLNWVSTKALDDPHPWEPALGDTALEDTAVGSADVEDSDAG